MFDDTEDNYTAGVQHYQDTDIEMVINGKSLGFGVLEICMQDLSWQTAIDSNMDNTKKISFDWNDISVHGKSTQNKTGIYVMINKNIVWPEMGYNGEHLNGNDENGHSESTDEMDVSEDDDSEQDLVEDTNEPEPLTEIWFYTKTDRKTIKIYQMMTHFASLHGDPLSDSEDGDGYITAEDLQSNDYEFYEDNEEEESTFSYHIDPNDKRFENAEDS